MSEPESPYPYPEGNGNGDQKTVGIITGVLSFAAVVLIAFTVWRMMRPKPPAQEVDLEAGPEPKPEGEEEDEEYYEDELYEGDLELQELPHRRPREPQSVYSSGSRLKKSDPKLLRQLPEQFPHLPRDVQQQIWDHAETPGRKKDRHKAPEPLPRQLRMQLWDSFPEDVQEHFYEKIDPDIQKHYKRCLKKQRLEKELAQLSSSSRGPQQSTVASSSRSSRRGPTDASSTYSSVRPPTTVGTSIYPPSEATFVDVPGTYPSRRAASNPPRLHGRRRALSSVLTLE
ncbi:hypothetical protein PgNI_11253 [Pyricularia grisea]|uniref:Uncharacterized protein n=1 Tax=Pyricularia grisea TaxID=148305 RepID=A0A6P8AQ43_PYRGI|nr:hypothetical protein PgNI_11253 [Pyricularia grisea]TLD04150.1 hypothetical protein PgNI_11253 [Pyricularia grisea]